MGAASFLFQQTVCQVLDFGPHKKCCGETELSPQLQFSAKCFRIIKKNEVCNLIFNVGEVPGAKFRREKDGRRFPLQKVLKCFRAEWCAFSRLRGQGEVHAKALNVQRQPCGVSPLLDCVLKPLFQRSAGQGGADETNGLRCGIHAVFREIQRFLLCEEGLLQLTDECGPIGSGRFFEIQKDTLIGSAAAFPQDSLAECGWVSNEWCVAVADAKQSAPGLQKEILSQQGGFVSDSIGCVSQRPVIAGGGLNLCG